MTKSPPLESAPTLTSTHDRAPTPDIVTVLVIAIGTQDECLYVNRLE
jgi:hypothetical protein